VNRTLVVWLAAVLVAAGVAAVAARWGQAAPAPQDPAACWDPAVRAQFETVFDRHRTALRDARNRVGDERYALRRLLTSPQATRAQVEAQATRLAEALAALERARVAFLWDLREALPADRREALLRCFVRPGPGWGPRWWR
jgi:Spy/CpxP family protein refolding chaperone